MAAIDTEDLAERLRAGERRALARAITLVESTRPEHRSAARDLIRRLATGGHNGGHGGGARRVGLSGTPGVGKSTFIEALGMMLVDEGLRVAVLAVDPSSARSGGSILGDKTRMERLSRSPSAFIRPSPAGRELGGVAWRTREAILLCEAAGFDIIIVETVGVGQSETMVAGMTDVFALLLAPAGGDELQGVKRGIMEIADLVIVNKADGELKPVAERTRADYAGALRLLRRREGDPERYPMALTASAATGEGLTRVWQKIRELDDWRRDTGWQAKRRAEQAVRWLRGGVERGLVERFHAEPRIRTRLGELERAVAAGQAAPEEAAEELIALFLAPGAGCRPSG